jgi:hypothetical protein
MVNTYTEEANAAPSHQDSTYLGLQITVSIAGIVHISQAPENLSGDLDNILLGKRSSRFLQQFLEIAVWNPIHHQHNRSEIFVPAVEINK